MEPFREGMALKPCFSYASPKGETVMHVMFIFRLRQLPFFQLLAFAFFLTVYGIPCHLPSSWNPACVLLGKH